ncbi:MAG: hypothetical protein AB8G22_19035, partial [Saprospiraceae bacterium]
MEGIIFIGLQGSGKSTFYKEKFFDKYLRISMDMLNTRNKERQILEKCLDLQQCVVIDNTNPTREVRASYSEKFHQKKNGDSFPTDVYVYRISVQGEDFLIIIWKDITDQKHLEAL